MPLDVKDAALLHDMLFSARRAVAYCNGRVRADLDTDAMFADALIRRIEIVGEAARGLSDAFLQAHGHIPWHAIRATRHILAHEYADVNHDIIWRIVLEHLPSLISQLQSILAVAPPPPEPPEAPKPDQGGA